MKNRIAKGAIAFATSLSILGSGIAFADDTEDQINKDYDKCVIAASKLEGQAKRDAYQDCNIDKAGALIEHAKAKKTEKDAKETAIEADREANYGSVDTDTWKDIDKTVGKEGEYTPGWLLILKYIQNVIEEIAKQIKPIFDIADIAGKLAPKK